MTGAPREWSRKVRTKQCPLGNEEVMGIWGAFSVEWWEQKLESRGSCVSFMSKEVSRSTWHFRRLFWNWCARSERGEAARGLLQASQVPAWNIAVGIERKRQMGGSLQGRLGKAQNCAARAHICSGSQGPPRRSHSAGSL